MTIELYLPDSTKHYDGELTEPEDSKIATVYYMYWFVLIVSMLTGCPVLLSRGLNAACEES